VNTTSARVGEVRRAQCYWSWRTGRLSPRRFAAPAFSVKVQRDRAGSVFIGTMILQVRGHGAMIPGMTPGNTPDICGWHSQRAAERRYGMTAPPRDERNSLPRPGDSRPRAASREGNHGPATAMGLLFLGGAVHSAHVLLHPLLRPPTPLLQPPH
jgi:hypothetical protein